MRCTVFLLLWLRTLVPAYSAAFYSPIWERVGTPPQQQQQQQQQQQKNQRLDAKYSTGEAAPNRAILNQLERKIVMQSLTEKVAALKKHTDNRKQQKKLEAAATITGKEEDEAQDVMKRASMSGKKEINRFLTRLLRFSQINSFGAGNTSNKKRSLYEIPVKNLPPAYAKAIEDGRQRQNNLGDIKDDLKNEGQGRFQAAKRSDGSIHLTLAGLKTLIDRIKQDADPLQSMLEHVAMEMKEETGNRPVDDDFDSADWFMANQRLPGGQIKKLDGRSKDGRYLRYGRAYVPGDEEEDDLGDDLGWSTTQDEDRASRDVLNKGINTA